MPITIEIKVDDNGAVTGVRKINQELDGLEKQTKSTGREVSNLNNFLLHQAKTILPAVTAGWVAFKALNLSKEALNIAGSFERMKISLDTVTKGRGEEWFKRLNDWARPLPMLTQAAVDGFIRLKAMGLEPTIEQMQILVDTTSALGGQSDTFDGIVLAMGQIYTKGKLMAQEIRQLAERGIPAYQILQEKLGITAAELEETGRAAIDADKALAALFSGMQERFGGQTQKMMGSYTGIIYGIKSNWQEWIRLVMDTGPFETVKDKLKDIRDLTEEMVKFREQEARTRQAAEYLKKQGVKPLGTASESTAMYIPGAAYTDDQIKQAIQNMYSEQLRKSRAGAVPTSPHLVERAYSDFTDEEKQVIARSRERLWSENGFMRGGRLNAPQTSFAIDVPRVGMFPETGLSGKRYENPLGGLLTDSDYRVTEEQTKKILELRRTLQDQSIRLAEDQSAAEIAVLKERFDEEYGMLNEHDQRRILAAQVLGNEIAIIQQNEADRMESQMLRIADTWADVTQMMMSNSDNAFEAILKSFESMAINMASAGLVNGILNIFDAGVTGGFGGGVTKYIKHVFGFQEGGYTGDTGGVVHKKEYVFPEPVVSQYGVGFFDRLLAVMKQGGGNSIQINQSFTPRERREMMSLDDDAFAERVLKVVKLRKV